MQAPLAADPEELTYLYPIGYEDSPCGYCKKECGNFSYMALCYGIDPGFYQAMLARSFRRSGKLLYKPNIQDSCCPHYSLRLDAYEFTTSKGQRQCLNRFNKYILGDHYIREAAKLYPRSRAEARRRDTEFNVHERVHETEYNMLRTPPEPAHKLTITLETDEYSDEKYAIFENYQRIVHKEEPRRITKDGFRDFLCDSPLRRSKPTIDGRERLLGSYHQCYRLDGELVAIGFLDLLPQCVSSVYFAYHESVHQHGFGKLAAMREIALAKEGRYQWWYAGFYIHTCPKMHYKMDYSPQYILDPETYVWDIVDDEVKRRLDEETYVCLSREQAAAAAPASSSNEGSAQDSAATITTTSTEVVPSDADADNPHNTPAGSDDPKPQEAVPSISKSTSPDADADADADAHAKAEENTQMQEPTSPSPSSSSSSETWATDSSNDPNDPWIPYYQRGIPGVMTLEQLKREIDIGDVTVQGGTSGRRMKAREIIPWDKMRVDKMWGQKCKIAELVAALGVDLLGGLVVLVRD